MTIVVDTNVALVTKVPEDWPIDLVDACEEFLERVLEGRLPVVTDEEGEIVAEYFHQLERSGHPTLGDAFAKYVHDYRFTWECEMRPSIEPDPVRQYTYGVLGEDHDEIDASDRKFVAAAKGAGVAVLEGTDTKWLEWGEVLGRHGVQVVYAHEPSIRGLYLKKFGHEAP